MARKPRVHFSGAFYHVMLRGNNRARIFFSDSDRRYFYFLIEEGVKRYCYQIHSFCLMDNHMHLVIQVGDIPLSKIMQHLSFRYASYINFHKKRVGHLFQGRFKAILVDSENYFPGLVRYVHMNPVHAGLVEKAENYFWSSHRAYLGFQDIPWLTKNFLLEFFNNNLSSYAEFICNESHGISRKIFQSGNQINNNVLASDEFMLKLQNIQAEKIIPFVKLDQIISLVCSHYSIDVKQLSDNRKTHVFSKARAKIAWLAREFSVCTFNKVACYFNRDATGLIRIVRQLEDSSAGKSELEKLKLLVQKSVCQA